MAKSTMNPDTVASGKNHSSESTASSAPNKRKRASIPPTALFLLVARSAWAAQATEELVLKQLATDVGSDPKPDPRPMVSGLGQRPYSFADVHLRDFCTLIDPSSLQKTPVGLPTDGWLNDTVMDNFITAVAASACRFSAKGTWCSLSASQSRTWTECHHMLRFGSDGSSLISEEDKARWRERKQKALQRAWSYVCPDTKEPQSFFSVEGLLVPFHHEGNHWTLLAISGKGRRVRVFDSMGRQDRPEIRFANALLRNGLGSLYDEIEWQQGLSPSQPQPDRKSCGVYALLSALALSQGVRPHEFLLGVAEVGLADVRRYIAACLHHCTILEAGEWKHPTAIE